MRTTIKNDFLTVEIDTLGAELKSILDKDGVERLWQGDEKYWNGQAPLLWPICGKLTEGRYIYNGVSYNMSAHGFGRDCEFSLEKKDDGSATYLLVSDEKSKEVYPFDYELRVIYALEENKINVTYVINNKTDGDMYFSIGSHEAYMWEGETGDYSVLFDGVNTLENSLLNGPFLSGKAETVVLKNGEMQLVDDDFAERDTYIFKNISVKRVSLVGKNTKKKITVDYPETAHLLLWKEPMAPFLCIEPWCALPDNDGVVSNLPEKPGINKLAKNEVFKNTHTITID